MYNIKEIHYPTGSQIRMYGNPILTGKPDSFSKDTKEKERFWYEYSNDKLDFTKLDYAKIAESKMAHSVSSSVNRTKNQIYYLARSNNFDWFFTLTFNPELVDSFNYDDVSKKLTNWLCVMKRNNPNLKYIVVPELHDSGRYHFHGLFSNCDNMIFVDSGHKTKIGDTIYNVDSYRLGFSTAVRLDSNVERISHYISKYITKDFCNATKGRKRFWRSRNLDTADISTYLVEDMQGYLSTISGVSKTEKLLRVNDVQSIYYFET